MKVLHLITGLEVGGAEMMLLNLLRQPVIASITSRVVSLTGLGTVGNRIQQLGIPVEALGMLPGQPDLRTFWQFARSLRQASPDLVQTWMYHADLFGALAARFAGNIPVVWGIHHTLDGDQAVRARTMRVLRLNAILSHLLPRRVVCCAESARQAHVRVGYSSRRMVVIPNGIDVEEFRPDPQAPSALRRELKLKPDTPVIGLFARFHPQKDHQTFALAAGLLHARMPGVHFLLVGDGVTPQNPSLAEWFRTAGVSDHVHLLGLRQDMPRLMAGVDLASLSSAYGEALPLSIAESMSCGTPCIVTDVGDAGRLVGAARMVVPPRSPGALAEAWENLLNLSPAERTSLGAAARSRILVGYNIVPVAHLYASLYTSIIS